MSTRSWLAWEKKHPASFGAIFDWFVHGPNKIQHFNSFSLFLGGPTGFYLPSLESCACDTRGLCHLLNMETLWVLASSQMSARSRLHDIWMPTRWHWIRTYWCLQKSKVCVLYISRTKLLKSKLTSMELDGFRCSTFRLCFPRSHNLEDSSTKGCGKTGFQKFLMFDISNLKSPAVVNEHEKVTYNFPKLDFRICKIKKINLG